MNKAEIEAQEKLKQEEEEAVKAHLNRLQLMQAKPDRRILINPAETPNLPFALSQALTGLLECFFSAEENNLELTHVSSKTP
ncbi:MAG: hypothetical protein A2X77_00055 [Gammaproteobacteria bacterium GWE2_42_36]|nr:MAG: hypothetical protein A2X77_00055 [Gammaproteobacteria bacterium GWE2_42_36]HCU04974.1 hypothetical protein [Coxiellaceae bacterium]